MEDLNGIRQEVEEERDATVHIVDEVAGGKKSGTHKARKNSISRFEIGRSERKTSEEVRRLSDSA